MLDMASKKVITLSQDDDDFKFANFGARKHRELVPVGSWSNDGGLNRNFSVQ